MTTVFDPRRRRVQLSREIGGGGEASVYEVKGDPRQLAKIYRPAPRPGYDQKLTWMRDNPPEDATRKWGHTSIAWPLDLLYNGQGQFVGYLMHYIQNAVPLLEVFNPRLRARTLPGFDWRYLHRTSRNLAVALGALHAGGYVVGDLNESNVMVTPSAMVTLIDTDSFQVRARGASGDVTYFCPVGKPEYTAPELQGRSLAHTRQHPEHDCFGLGVLIFQLLMGGSHPFRAQWLGNGDPPPIEEKIRRGAFPYVKSPPLPVAPPRNAPTLDVLHPLVAELVRRCFIEGHPNPSARPSAREWESAITAAEKALVSCRNDHYYSGHCRACPRCGETPRAKIHLRLPRPAASTRARASSVASAAPASGPPVLPAVARQWWPAGSGIPGTSLAALVSWLKGGAGTTRLTSRDVLAGAGNGALVWAAGGAIFGAIGGVMTGAMGQVLLWALIWAVLWSSGWWAFGEVLGETIGGSALGKAVGVSGALGGAITGGGLGWAIGEQGIEAVGGWAVVKPLVQIVARLLGDDAVAGTLGHVLVGLIGGLFVGAAFWILVGAVGGAIGYRTIGRQALGAGLVRAPGKLVGVMWAAVGAVEGASAGAVGGALVGALVGGVTGTLGGIVSVVLVRAIVGAVLGACIGALGGTVGRRYVEPIGQRFSRAFGVVQAAVGLTTGLVVARGDLDLWTNGQIGIAAAAEGALVGLVSGALAGLIGGALFGGIGGALVRLTDA